MRAPPGARSPGRPERRAAVTLQDLFDRAGVRLKAGGPASHGDVTALAYDSRQGKPGAVFLALRGVNADRTPFAPQAIANRASAVVAETPPPAGVTVPWVQVAHARAALAAASAAFYGN